MGSQICLETNARKTVRLQANLRDATAQAEMKAWRSWVALVCVQEISTVGTWKVFGLSIVNEWLTIMLTTTRINGSI